MQVRVKVTSKNRGLLAAYFEREGIPAVAAALRSGASQAEFAMVDSERWRSMLRHHRAAMEAYGRRLAAIASGEIDPEPDWV